MPILLLSCLTITYNNINNNNKVLEARTCVDLLDSVNPPLRAAVYHPHFPDEETKAQACEVTGLGRAKNGTPRRKTVPTLSWHKSGSV